MSKNKVIKSVSFNQKNADDELILKHVKRRNFTAYVKKLILEDININQKVETKATMIEVNKPVEKDNIRKLTVAEKLELKKKEIKKRAISRPFIPQKD
ncbi:hypothetical protein BKP37_12610 [Anaerobacillus alkalilacustris]|uniref:Uncharacterized protein n=1 Tax=Anaerobacillus alkalilacustris TaxID=393763 RepID=A0A1S2LJD4_9BACI|nr:hypothetical protein [Anaerobacillus alkalilacustris]OIJ12639.1 hypothetical protein BKP37_12610 [Anaerobacillus alkalilacustris]